MKTVLTGGRSAVARGGDEREGQGRTVKGTGRPGGTAETRCILAVVVVT